MFLYFYLLGGETIGSDLYPLEKRGEWRRGRPWRLLWPSSKADLDGFTLSSPLRTLRATAVNKTHPPPIWMFRSRQTTSCGQPAGFTYVSEGGAKENAPPSPDQQEVWLCFIRIMSHKMQIKVFKNPYFTTFLIHFTAADLWSVSRVEAAQPPPTLRPGTGVLLADPRSPIRVKPLKTLKQYPFLWPEPRLNVGSKCKKGRRKKLQVKHWSRADLKSVDVENSWFFATKTSRFVLRLTTHFILF